MSETPRNLSHLLLDLQAKLYGERISVDLIIQALHERGIGAILFILALPMALPIPVPPGINILLASPLLVLTLQQMIGRHTIWMPRSIRAKSISRPSLEKTLKRMIPWAQRLEVLVKPRLGWMTLGVFSYIIGLCGTIMALSIMIPLPLTNTVPSLGIALMAIGVLMRDGLAVLAGMAIGMAWVGMLAFAIIFFGTEGIDALKELIKSLL